jgi:hypothetical protein
VEGTNTCITCGREFDEKRPCWSDYKTFNDGSHSNGICVYCYAKDELKYRIHRNAINWIYENNYDALLFDVIQIID